MLEPQIQIHPIIGQPNWRMDGTNLDLSKNGSPRSAIHWHVLPGASTKQIKKYIQENFNGQIQESFYERILSMSLSTGIEWTEKGNTDTCLHHA